MYLLNAAASVRLCVETEVYFQDFEKENAAASVRLCVETQTREKTDLVGMQPPSRGCVLKLYFVINKFFRKMQPPSRGCVLKRAFFNQFLAA